MPRITRRDFLNGVALTVASGLTPAAQLAADPAGTREMGRRGAALVHAAHSWRARAAEIDKVLRQCLAATDG